MQFFLSLIFLFSSSAFALELKYVDSIHWPAVSEFNGSKTGGLSGISPMGNGHYLLISDDRGAVGPSRAYEFEIGVDSEKNKLQIKVIKEIQLRNSSGNVFARNALDPEGIVSLGDGSFLVSTEGDTRTNPRIAPAVSLFDSEGNWKQEIPVPEKFIPEFSGNQTRGILNNESLEGLTLAPDQENLFSMVESPLLQDGFPSGFLKGSVTRMIQWKKTTGGNFLPVAEFAYPLSAVPQLFGNKDGDGINGVSEILALDAKTVLVLERAFVFNQVQAQNSIRIFKAEIEPGENISDKSALLNTDFVSMNKTLIFDFDVTLPLLPENHRWIDNLEGMTFGPKLQNGRRSLLVISDSNFLARQETQFFLLEIQE